MKYCILLVGLFFGFFSFGQKSNNALILLNGMLATEKLSELEPNNVKSVQFYKTQNSLPPELSNFQNYLQNGLVNIQLKENHFDYISLKKLNLDFKLDPNQAVYYNDIKFENTDILVITNGIEYMEVQQKDGAKHLHLYTYSKEKTSPMALQ